LKLPQEPRWNQRNLHWPSSVKYLDDTHSLGNAPQISVEQSRAATQVSGTVNDDTATSLVISTGSLNQSLAQRHSRLLNLLPGEYNDPLHIKLKIKAFQLGLAYEALSYTWANAYGDARNMHCIYVGDSWDVIRQRPKKAAPPVFSASSLG
jgi:hypothetical protein